MSRQNTLPKHSQLSEMLIREIMSGRIPNGTRLPTERQMAADFDVAVGTLRKALAILQDKGLLERIQGSGNYVRSQTDISSIYSFFRIELAEGGGLPTAMILSARKLMKPQDAPYFGDSAYGHCIRRLRFLNDQPIAVEEIWLDNRFIDDISTVDLSDSLYLFYKENLNLVISRVQDLVSVGTVPEWSPEGAGISAGETVGYIERIGWDQEGQPAEFSKTWFNPKTARYTARLT
jgi:GntR family transcriptional regulator